MKKSRSHLSTVWVTVWLLTNLPVLPPAPVINTDVVESPWADSKQSQSNLMKSFMQNQFFDPPPSLQARTFPKAYKTMNAQALNLYFDGIADMIPAQFYVTEQTDREEEEISK